MIVVITGAPGSGKSKTCKFLLDTSFKSAWVDGDWLLATNPFDRSSQRLLRYKNIASLVKNYYESGFGTIYVSFVYARQEDLRVQIELFEGIDEVKVVALIPNEEVLQKRHHEDTYNRVDIDSAIALNNKIKNLKDIKTLDNSNLSIEEAARKIIQLIA